jgi:hypothetical protein
MLIRSQSIYRGEALEYQRRRLSGEISVEHKARLWALSALFVVLAAGALGGLSLLSVPVTMTTACSLGASPARILLPAMRPSRFNKIDEITLASGKKVLGRFAVASSRATGSGQIELLVAPAPTEMAGSLLSRDCTAALSIRTSPLMAGAEKFLPR